MVHIVGAGAGDPDLITIKGYKLLSVADVVIYAGSLVNKEILKFCKTEAEIYDSAAMTLDEIIKIISAAEEAKKMTVRLHTGDPSIYGAIQEQIIQLKKAGIEYDIVPGVSSFLAAAAAIKREYTLPNITQTIIITRYSGRTIVPETESLRKLAQHRTTLCIFLSINFLEEVKQELLLSGLEPSTPIAVVYKVSWKGEEKIIFGCLSDIIEKTNVEKIDRTALIIVGQCLGELENFEASKLYSAEFSHSFRQRKNSK